MQIERKNMGKQSKLQVNQKLNIQYIIILKLFSCKAIAAFLLFGPVCWVVVGILGGASMIVSRLSKPSRLSSGNFVNICIISRPIRILDSFSKLVN
jgi:hypothetical protein